MLQPERSRSFWQLLLIAIIAAGILSRVVHTGFVLFDKYLGDALYAAMVYVLFRVVTDPKAALVGASLAMIAIELFQLTRIPAAMLRSEFLLVRVCGRLLGTEFSVLDLLAYAAGIAAIAIWDRSRRPVYSS